jgi:hypothetical protein
MQETKEQITNSFNKYLCKDIIIVVTSYIPWCKNCEKQCAMIFEGKLSCIDCKLNTRRLRISVCDLTCLQEYCGCNGSSITYRILGSICSNNFNLFYTSSCKKCKNRYPSGNFKLI